MLFDLSSLSQSLPCATLHWAEPIAGLGMHIPLVRSEENFLADGLVWAVEGAVLKGIDPPSEGVKTRF